MSIQPVLIVTTLTSYSSIEMKYRNVLVLGSAYFGCLYLLLREILSLGDAGGGGGVLHIKTKEYIVSPAPTLSVSGGVGGTSVSQFPGGNGGVGLLQIDIFQ